MSVMQCQQATMPDCDYCEESFDDEQAYLHHLKDSHEGELGSIDRRRVENELGAGDDSGPPVVLIGVTIGLIIVVAALAYVVTTFDAGSSNGVSGQDPAQEPGPVGSAHEHGSITMTIDGEQVDFSESQYQLQADAFHFESGNGQIWHKHATGVTLEWAMASLGIEVTENSVTYQGTTYDDSDPGTNVTIEVNGEPVDPASYVLQGTEGESTQQGDQIRIVVTTDDE